MVSALGMAHAVVGSESLDRTLGGGGSEVDMAGASADRNLRRDGRQAQDAGGSQAMGLGRPRVPHSSGPITVREIAADPWLRFR